MSKRYFNIPKTLQISNGSGEMVDLPFTEFAIDILLQDNRWGASRADMREGDEVEDEVKGKKEGDPICLRQEVHAKLLKRALNPRFGAQNVGYHPNVRKISSYIDVIEEASKTPPKKTKKKKA
eukprot:GHVR01169911.1.p1 GENE.GHVR01169911.1~~GHVR01169911.1.p1  ORF type:complete len:123 (-),score=8.13 GHVR01169911.1:445-813(-)